MILRLLQRSVGATDTERQSSEDTSQACEPSLPRLLRIGSSIAVASIVELEFPPARGEPVALEPDATCIAAVVKLLLPPKQRF